MNNNQEMLPDVAEIEEMETPLAQVLSEEERHLLEAGKLRPQRPR